MPGYKGNGLATLLRSNQQGDLWLKESVPVGSYSTAFQLERISHSSYPWGLSFEAVFSADPGTFEIDILGANNDTGDPGPGNYVQLGTITSVNASFVGRLDMASNMWPKFVRAYLKTLTNAVVVSLQVTR